MATRLIVSAPTRLRADVLDGLKTHPFIEQFVVNAAASIWSVDFRVRFVRPIWLAVLEPITITGELIVTQGAAADVVSSVLTGDAPIRYVLSVTTIVPTSL